MKQQTTQNQSNTTFNPFSGPEIGKIIPVTPSQSEIWTACMLGGENANRAYNESISLSLHGNLNRRALEDAIHQLVQRHEALRATFSPDGRFMMIIEQSPTAITHQDLSAFEETEKNKAIHHYVTEDANHAFDLVHGPLFRVGLLKISESQHQLILTAHHMICDGWSFGIMLEELGAFYSAMVMGVPPTVPEAETYSSYASEERKFLSSPEFKTTQDYWVKQYENAVPTVTLPTDFQRPSLRTFDGQRLDFKLDQELTTQLKQVGIQAGASFVVTLLAAFEVFLSRQTGQNDLVLGLPAAGQSVSGKTQLIGHCVNLLPLRSQLNQEISFHNYIQQRKSAIFDAYEHQQFSFGQLLQKLPISRDPSRIPLVPIMFNIDMGMTSAVAFEGLEYTVKSNPRTYEAFELFLNATGTEDHLTLEWSFNVSLFKPETIRAMMHTFKETIESLVHHPKHKLSELIKADQSAYDTLNASAASYPKVPLHELLTRQAHISGTKQAIQLGDTHISYETLEQRTNQYAQYLLAQGVTPGTIIAVALPRSIELVVTLIAILKCGGTYLPLDPSYPSSRINFMLEDAEANYVITTETCLDVVETKGQIFKTETIFDTLSEYPTSSVDLSVQIDELAYLMYTSGSTGNPKGVMITHENLVNFLTSMMHTPGIEEEDRVLSITTISFDIAGLELFLPLLKGATLLLTDDETVKDSRLLLERLKEDRITILQATPTTWQMLLDAGWSEKLPIKALCGGEALPMGLAKKILDRVQELWNVYGPTETTVWSSVQQIKADDDRITIGKPIANTQLYILDEQHNLVPPNAVGELCIAGDGVAKGYWKRKELTQEKFISNPFDTLRHTVLYRTGDLAKLLPSGEVQCLGRIDHQVKIRGHRIELGEIEQAVDTFKEVHSTVVVVKNDILIAHILAPEMQQLSETKINQWKKELAKTLPPHMVPRHFNRVDAFPTTLNGKIDRKAVLNIPVNSCNQDTFSAPDTPSEHMIATIWQECLGIETIDIHSDFFELGGHSLIAVRVMATIEKQTGNRLPLAALLEQPTIHKLAAYLDRDQISWDCLVPLQPKGDKTPLFIVHGANYNVLIFKNLAKNLAPNQPVYALQAKGLDGASTPHSTVEDMAAHYISEIETVAPNGPYALAGFSFGGVIAFEMAKQLKARGKAIQIVALFDTYIYPPLYYSNSLSKALITKLYALPQFVFMLANMCTGAKNFKRRADAITLQVQGWYLRLKYGREKQHELQFSHPLLLDEMHTAAFNSYTITSEDINVDLFRATKNIFFAHDFNHLGWTKIALGGIQKHMIPGSHSEMFEFPAVAAFGERLQHLLDTPHESLVQSNSNSK